jgi:hypothetical protein
MIFTANEGQVSYGESIGILLLETRTPFIQGDVGNATSYDFPVRYRTIPGLTATKIFNHDLSFVDKMIEGAQELEREGVKAITGDCGFMAIYHREVKEAVNIPVLLSSLLQLPFIQSTLPQKAKIGILTANSRSLTGELLGKIGVKNDGTMIIRGLENEKDFKDAVIDEIGILNSDGMRQEMVSTALELTRSHTAVKSILLECSMMPPYGDAVQKATGLPVYDFLTMINYAHSSLVKRHFEDSM